MYGVMTILNDDHEEICVFVEQPITCETMDFASKILRTMMYAYHAKFYVSDILQWTCDFDGDVTFSEAPTGSFPYGWDKR